MRSSSEWTEYEKGWVWIGPKIELPTWVGLSLIRDNWQAPCVVRDPVTKKLLPGIIIDTPEEFAPIDYYTEVGWLATDTLEEAQHIADAQVRYLEQTTSRYEWDYRAYCPESGRWVFAPPARPPVPFE